MSCGIYKITNNMNAKVYVGQSRDIQARWQSELAGNCNKHLSDAFKKYGKANFTFTIVKEFSTDVAWQVLDAFEKAHIFSSESWRRECGYNKTMGGDGVVATPEVRQKMSASAKGKIISQATRAKISAAVLKHLGKE